MSWLLSRYLKLVELPFELLDGCCLLCEHLDVFCGVFVPVAEKLQTKIVNHRISVAHLF